MNKTKILSCLMALLFTTSLTNNNVVDSGLKAYDNLYEIGSTKTPKRAAEDETVAQNLVSDVKVQVTTLEDNQTRDMRFVAAIDSLNYEEVGFEITLIKSETESKTVTQKVEIAYTGIEVGGVVSSTSTFFGSTYKYMIAFELTDIPASSYGYQYSAVAYVKNGDLTTKSETPKEVSISNIAYDDMVSNAIANKRSFALTKVVAYGGTWISFAWDGNTSFTAADVDLTKNLYIRLTLNDGTVYYYDKGNENVVRDGTYGFNYQFLGLETEKLDFKKVELVINNNGELNYCSIEFSQLPTLSNVNLSDDYTLTFDSLDNAESYKVKIYNDNYSSEEVTFTSGSKLTTAGLDVGTYNVDITAVAKFGYSNSVTTLENAITIENVQEIINATDYYDIEFVHSGNAWEGVVNFKALSAAYTVTGTQKVTNFEVYAGENKVPNAAIIQWGGAPDAYDYTKDNGYHSLSFSINEWYQANTTYTVKFLVTADSEITYSIEFSYIVGDPAEGEFPIDINSYTKNHYLLLLNNAYNSLNSEDYEEDVWTSITNLYNEQLTAINAENATNEDAEAAVNTFTSGISSYVEQKLTFIAAEASSGTSSLAIDGKSDTRWESAHEEDGQYIIVHLDEVYALSRLNISWEAANASAYNIHVSPDTEGDTWTEVKTLSDLEGGNRVDKWTFDTLVDARRIKIECVKRNLTYGYSIFEIEAYGYIK